MLDIYQRREAALGSILGLGEGRIIGEYPKTVRLPQLIIERAFDAVEVTGTDHRERAINFRYNDKNDTWRGGRSFTGGEVSIAEDENRIGLTAEVGGAALQISRFYRSHIFLHTHPDFTQHEGSMAAFGRLEERTGKKIEHWPCHTFPSWDDLFAFAAGGGGTIGNIISSNGGNFLLLHQEPRNHLTWRTDKQQRTFYQRSRRLHASRSSLGKTLDRLIDEDKASYSRHAIATATAGTFACYYSADRESPYLDRIEPQLPQLEDAAG